MDKEIDINDEAGLNDEFTGAQKTVIILGLVCVGLLVFFCYAYMYVAKRLFNKINTRVQWSRLPSRDRSRNSNDDEDRLDIDFNNVGGIWSTSWA